MLQIKLKPHLSLEEIRSELDSKTDIKSFKKWQIILAVANNPGKKSEDLAIVLGVSKEIIQRTIKQYNEHGVDFENKIKWGGRRDTVAHLSLEEEKKTLEKLSQKALEGKILTAKEVKKVIEKKLNKPVSDDYIWDLFRRFGWRKKAPRPYHPKQDKKAQEEFKKNSPWLWEPTTPMN